MLALLLASLCTISNAPDAIPSGVSFSGPSDVAQGKSGKPIKALDAWMKLYRKGKVDYRDTSNIGKDSIALKYKIRKQSDLGNPSWPGDLVIILKAVAKQNNAVAARKLAEVASVGLEAKSKYTYSMAPYMVRADALIAIATMTSKEAKDELAVGARGEWKAGKHAKAQRAAALLALGHIADPSYDSVIEAALTDPETTTRIHAVLALQQLGHEKATKSLIEVLKTEEDSGVLVTTAKALRKIYGKHMRAAEDKLNREKIRSSEEPKEQADDSEDAAKKKETKLPPPPTARLAVQAAIQALGRSDWRADTVLVRLLNDFRSAESLPALISILERFRNNPKNVENGNLSGLLLVQAHELLVSMTGAIIPADQPEKWRELWERDKDSIKVSEKRPAMAKGSGTASTGFVGIPVEGTRVIFILDLSGSMDWPMNDESGRVRRLDYAKRELIKAVDGLAPNAMFNLVTFNGDDEAEDWSKKLVHATKRNRDRFKKFVEKLRPLGGTNLWSGIEAALNIKTLVYGNHYETSTDEIFLLSDGAPSVGDVQDPIEILRLIQEINRFKEVRINTVFISSQTPPEVAAQQRQMSLSPQALMKRIAKENGGKFKDV